MEIITIALILICITSTLSFIAGYYYANWINRLEIFQPKKGQWFGSGFKNQRKRNKKGNKNV